MEQPKRKKPMRLPFDKNKSNGDWGGMIYRYRVGVLSTIIVYLVGTIAFLSYRIVINTTSTDLVAIEFEQEQQPEPEITPEEREKIERDDAEFTKVMNKVSDANSKLNSELRDSKKSDASEIYKEAERVNRELAQGRQEYENGLREIERTNRRTERQQDNKNKDNEKGNERAKVDGMVTIEYDLPGRHDVYLHRPTYTCQYGGRVVIGITVNRNGKVVDARVVSATSSPDDCTQRMALQSAQASTFNASQTSPDKQKGTITYTFMAQ